MKLIITDTNVFFDLINIQALPEFFSMDYEICTTDFVLNEILFSSQKNQIDAFIRSGKLTVYSFTSKELDEINTMITKRNLRVLTDKTVLWKSLQLKCPILTGDMKLRKEAEDFGISVYGDRSIKHKKTEGLKTATKWRPASSAEAPASVETILPGSSLF